MMTADAASTPNSWRGGDERAYDHFTYEEPTVVPVSTS
jgi:hypothetical protein